VAAAADAGSEITDREVIDCVVAAFRTLTFPSHDDVITVVYPIQFSRDPDAPSVPATRGAPVPPSQPVPPGIDASPSPYTGKRRDVMSAIAERDFASARRIATSWRLEDPGDVTALVALGESLEASGDFATAARAYGSIL